MNTKANNHRVKCRILLSSEHRKTHSPRKESFPGDMSRPLTVRRHHCQAWQEQDDSPGYDTNKLDPTIMITNASLSILPKAHKTTHHTRTYAGIAVCRHYSTGFLLLTGAVFHYRVAICPRVIGQNRVRCTLLAHHRRILPVYLAVVCSTRSSLTLRAKASPAHAQSGRVPLRDEGWVPWVPRPALSPLPCHRLAMLAFPIL